MPTKQTTFLLFLTLFLVQVEAWPLPDNFMAGFNQNMANMMSNLQNNMRRMTRNLNNMGQNMYARNQAVRDAVGNLQPGQRRVFDDGNIRGIAYRSPDGGFTSYSFSSGSPGNGYMFYSGPDGTYQRSW